MKERGLLMTPVNYGRCKDGSKTQTRRIITPQPHAGISSFHFLATGFKPAWSNFEIDHTNEDNRIIKCPYGVPGDRLYVKEGLERHGERHIQYRRDKTPLAWFDGTIQASWEWQRDTLSPLHMPKWAARLWLELTDVRIEQLGLITEEDARAEGVKGISEFSELWKSIHDNWEPSLWLWILEFRQVSRSE